MEEHWDFTATTIGSFGVCQAGFVPVQDQRRIEAETSLKKTSSLELSYFTENVQV